MAEQNIFSDEDDQRSNTVPLELYDRAIEELTEALRITGETLGDNRFLPAVKGTAWFDALAKYTPAKAAAFLEGKV